MAIYHNTKPHALDFSIANKHFNVPIGGEVEIDDRFTYVVESRGLPLHPGPAPSENAPKAVVEAEKAPVVPPAAQKERREAASITLADPDDADDEDGDDDEDGAVESKAGADIVKQATANLAKAGVKLPGRK